MIIFSLSILTATLGTLLLFSIRRNLQLMDKFDEISSQVEESLDILDEYHQRIDLKSRTEVMFDDPLVKDLIQDIKGCKDAVLLIANKVYSPLDDEEENNEGNTP